MNPGVSTIADQMASTDVVGADWLDGSDASDPIVVGFNVKSTAPEVCDPPKPLEHQSLSQDGLLNAIKSHLLMPDPGCGKQPHIVIQVHGFNNPPDVSLVRYQEGFDTLKGQGHPAGLVFLGYDWPSEKAWKIGVTTKMES